MISLGRWIEYETPYCNITIEKRVPHCKRGRYFAKAFPKSRKCEVNDQSGWPRYYFSLEVAIQECEAWLKAQLDGEDVGTYPWMRRELVAGGQTQDYGSVQYLGLFNFLEGSDG